MHVFILLVSLLIIPYSQAGAYLAFPGADLNHDEVENYEDFIIFASQWLAGDTSAADFSSDGNVNFQDFALLASQWMHRPYSGGSGTLEAPYLLSTVTDWQELMTRPANWHKSFVLTSDINLQGIEITPIGDSNQNFTGTFNGADHRILNVVIDRPESEYVGLFGYVGNGASVYNLGLESVNITGRNHVGGLIGHNDFSNINYCHTTGTINGTYYTGGLIGSNTGSIHNSFTRCAVYGSSDANYIGGLIGDNSGDVNYCYAMCFVGVDIDSDNIGGLIGANSGNVAHSYSDGNVVGYDNSQFVGGLIGNNSGEVDYCYATDSVYGGSDVGGLVGINYGAVDNCFWDVQTSGQTTSAGGTGKTTNEMKTIDTFISAGWDFVNIDKISADWKIVEYVTYPMLLWESNGQLTMVAAADAPEWFKAIADYTCVGSNDDATINIAINNDRHVILSSGTFNIASNVRVDYNNIILEGQGPSTVIRNTTGWPHHVIYQFGPNHHITIKNLLLDNNDFGDPGNAYNKCLFINGNYNTVIGIDNNKYLCIKAHISSPDNRPGIGPNYTAYWAPFFGWGWNETWATGQSYTGIDSCNNILIEGVTAHNSKAEVICVDYAENITIRDCNSYNGSWSGITVAHTRYSSIYNNQVRHCGESPNAGYEMSRGINVIGSSHVSIHDNSISDCLSGGIGVNETYGVVESEDINIYNNYLTDILGGPGIIVGSSDGFSSTNDVNVWGNYVNAYKQAYFDVDGTAIDNGNGKITIPAASHGFREGLNVTIAGTMNYNGVFSLKSGTDDDHLVISHPYVAETFNGTETALATTVGMYFDYVANFNAWNNTIMPGPGSYWCYVTQTASNGLIKDNLYTAGRDYRNYSPSTIFTNNTTIQP